MNRVPAFALVAVIALWAGGCAADLARGSAGAIGCPASAIEVTDVSVGWNETSWTATCRQQVFHCSGESTPQCAPALQSAATSAAPGTRT